MNGGKKGLFYSLLEKTAGEARNNAKHCECHVRLKYKLDILFDNLVVTQHFFTFLSQNNEHSSRVYHYDLFI